MEAIQVVSSAILLIGGLSLFTVSVEEALRSKSWSKGNSITTLIGIGLIIGGIHPFLG